MSYNIMRIGKIKDRKQMADTAGHNFRLRKQPNIDADKSHLNQVLLNTLNMNTSKRSGFADAFEALYKEKGIKEKSNSVLACEVVVSASPEFFSTMIAEDVDKWAKDQVNFMKKQFGENCRLAILHKDEKTPHLHFLISTEEKKVRTYKNRHGSTTKEAWSINAKRWGPEYLKDMHTAHAEHNKGWGLIRGQSKPGTAHKPLKQYYKELEQKEADLKTELGKMEEKEALLIKAMEYLKKAKAVMDEQFETISNLLEMLMAKDLTPEEQEKVNEIATTTLKKSKVNKKI